MKRRASTGVILIGIVAVLIGLFELWMGNGEADLPIIIPLVIGACLIISGAYILLLKNWARISLMLGMGLYAVHSLSCLILDPRLSGESATYQVETYFGWFLIAGLPVLFSSLYLSRPEVKARFTD